MFSAKQIWGLPLRASLCSPCFSTLQSEQSIVTTQSTDRILPSAFATRRVSTDTFPSQVSLISPRALSRSAVPLFHASIFPKPIMSSPAFTAPAVLPRAAAASLLAISPCRAPPCATMGSVSRRSALSLGAALLLAPLSASAATLTSTKGTKTAMTGDYKTDAARMLADMKMAAALARGTEGMEDTVKRVRADMNDFVALYRRNDKVSGTTSYSVLYTASNTLSGHYASYGPLYPVPEKRKKRLNQQFTEVERALARGR